MTNTSSVSILQLRAGLYTNAKKNAPLRPKICATQRNTRRRQGLAPKENAPQSAARAVNAWKTLPQHLTRKDQSDLRAPCGVLHLKRGTPEGARHGCKSPRCICGLSDASNVGSRRSCTLRLIGTACKCVLRYVQCGTQLVQREDSISAARHLFQRSHSAPPTFG